MRDLNGHDWFVLFFSARNVKLLGRSLHHWLFYYLQHWHIIYLIFRMDAIGWKFMERAVSQLPLLIARAWLNRFSDFCLRFLTIPFLIMNLHNPSLVVLLSRCYEALFCPLSLFQGLLHIYKASNLSLPLFYQLFLGLPHYLSL